MYQNKSTEELREECSALACLVENSLKSGDMLETNSLVRELRDMEKELKRREQIEDFVFRQKLEDEEEEYWRNPIVVDPIAA